MMDNEGLVIANGSDDGSGGYVAEGESERKRSESCLSKISELGLHFTRPKVPTRY